MGCPSRLQVNQINTDNEINNAYCLRMPRLDDLTDVCKDGNLLKVNSCNCAAELDEAKEGVSTASIIIRRKKSLKSERKREIGGRGGGVGGEKKHHIPLQRDSAEQTLILWMCFI